MATGDITSVTIGAEGWYADVVVEGFTTGATYDFGLDADNAPTADTPYLTVVSEGYSAAGVLGTVTRTVYLTTALRKAYPNDAQTFESTDGSSLTVRVALSDHVYDDDKAGGAGTSGTDPVLHAPAGWVTSGGTPSNAATVTAVNSSTLDYAPVLGNWSRPDRDRLATPSVTLAAVAFHGQPKNRRPVACVKFTATNGTQTATTTVADPTVDLTYGDPVPVVEHIGTVDLTGFTDDTLVTCTFQAYPWVGDENSILTNSGTEYLGKVPSQYYVLDTNGSRGYPIVVVSPTGNDALLHTDSVKASDTEGNRTAAAAAPVATIARAIRLLYEHNLAVNDRSNPMGGTVYLASGTHSVIGGAPSVPTTVTGDIWTWTTVTPLPGATAILNADATATNRAQITKGMRWLNCTFERASDVYFLRGSASQKALVQGCTMTDSRTSHTYGTMSTGVGPIWYVKSTFNKVTPAGDMPSLYRGCTFPTGYRLAQARLCLGTLFTHANPSIAGSIFVAPSSTANDAEGAVVAFNRFLKLRKPLLSIFQLADTVYTAGAAVVQNLVELLDTAGEPAVYLSADGTTSSTRNCVIWHNTVTGQRVNLFYNDEGTAATPHLGHSVGLNAFEYQAAKGDTFNATVSGPQGARTGNWAYDNGVKTHGNKVERGAFNQRFRGLHSEGGTDSVPVLLGYVNDLSGSGGAGNGDYSPAPGSILRSVRVDPLVAYDLTGTERATADAAGAYAIGAPAGLPARGGVLTAVGGTITVR